MSDGKGLPRTPIELERSLIASARLDVRPAPQVVRNRILAVTTAAGFLGTGTAVAGATSGALGRLAVVKWIAATAIVGAASVGGDSAGHPPHPPAPHRRPAREPPPPVAPRHQAPALSPPPSHPN